MRRGRKIRLGSLFSLAAALSFFVLLAMAAAPARADVAFLMEEPYGHFGAFNPTGHAAVYLNRVCAETPTRLRMCRSGEYGVVISRYHKISGLDWVAVPLVPYLYSVEAVDVIPQTVSREQVAALRDAYRRRHLEALAPDVEGDQTPGGEWTQLVGSSYDRTIHGFVADTTVEEDERFIAVFNDKRNIGHFNLFFHNCADFSRVVLDTYMPHSIHRNFIADAGLMTPKQVARSLVKYGKQHPERNMRAFVIPQVPGSVPRSHGVDGVAESLVKSKKYLLPMVVLTPHVTGGIVLAYLVDGRMPMPKDATVFHVGDAQVGDVSSESEGALPGDSRQRLPVVPSAAGQPMMQP